MTLILQLLFEPHFKRIFTEVLLGHYSQLMEEWAVKPPEAVMPLDMITVQLFNDEVCNHDHAMTHGYSIDEAIGVSLSPSPFLPYIAVLSGQAVTTVWFCILG